MDINSRATLHEVELTEEEIETFDEDDDISIFNAHKTSSWKRGDVLAVKGKWGYRNMYKAMWDGEKTIPLGCDIGDYGHVPREFVVGKEFHSLYWEDVIDYNYYVYACFKDCDNIESVEYDGCQGKIVTINDKRWLIMAKGEPVSDEIIYQETDMYLYPHQDHHDDEFELSQPMVQHFNIPLERILWVLE